MRFFTYLLASCLLLTQPLSAQTDLEKINVKGKPKKIVTREYNAKDEFGKPSKTEMERSFTALFNTAGYMTTETIAKESGTVILKRVFECDAMGKAISLSIYSASGSLLQKNIFQYDATGKQVIDIGYDEKGVANTKTEYKYDSKGNIIEENTYYLTSDKKEPATDKKNYNEAGKVTERVFTNPYLPNQIGKVICAYNENGDIISLKSVTLNATTKEEKTSVTYYYTYQYDSQKNWTSQTVLKGEAKIVNRIIEREYTY